MDESRALTTKAMSSMFSQVKAKEEHKQRVYKAVVKARRELELRTEEHGIIEEELKPLQEGLRAFAIANFRVQCALSPCHAPCCDVINNAIRLDDRLEENSLYEIIDALGDEPFNFDFLMELGLIRGAAGIPRICTKCGCDREHEHAKSLPCYMCGQWRCERSGSDYYNCQCNEEDCPLSFDTSGYDPTNTYGKR